MVDIALPGPQRWKVQGGSRVKVGLAVLVVAALGVGIAQGRPGHDARPGLSAGASTAALTGQGASKVAEGVGATSGAPAPALSGATTDSAPAGSDAGAATADLGPQIVRTGSVDLAVPAAKVSGVLTGVSAVAARLQGTVSDSKTSESGPEPSGSVTLRVPSARTDEAVREVRALGHVNSVTTASQDVTGQVVDVSARLTALDASRDRYLDLLGHAGTIAEILQVQQKVDGVQTQIEQLQAQKKALADQTSLSTLVVTVTTRDSAAPAVPHSASGISKAWHDARTRFGDGVESVVAASGTAAFLLLFAAGAGLLFVGARAAVRRMAAH